MTNPLIPVFVYGTLKKGCGNHHWLGDATDPILASATGLRMHDGPGYPMAMRGNGVVHGELYWVDQETLDQLDLLEGCPDYYNRQLWKLNQPAISAWIYLCSEATRYPVIESGHWCNR
ncbi:MAG: gamma-glutamylcyclotransferase [Magnetococcales bacterium]|nr:gamma-glutamylcyclotransferase [Magnetococcales bacterium]